MADLLSDVQDLERVVDDLAAAVALGLLVERSGDARGTQLAADAVRLADQIQISRGVSPIEVGALAPGLLARGARLTKRVVPRLAGMARAGSLTWIALGTITAGAYVLTAEERTQKDRIDAAHEALTAVAESLTPEQRARLAGQLAGQLAEPTEIPWPWILGLSGLGLWIWWRSR